MELMRELSLAPGVSGSEEEIANIITRELKDVADKIETDSMGNLIATKKGKKKAPRFTPMATWASVFFTQNVSAGWSPGLTFSSATLS